LIFINLIRAAYVVRRPCSDFTDMLRRLINCRIIIIIIIINCATQPTSLGLCIVVERCDLTVIKEKIYYDFSQV